MKIFITRKIPEKGLELLKKEHEIEINPHDRVFDAEVIHSEPKLKMIANYAVGFNNIDIKVATERGIPVSNTPDVLTNATAEMAWALLFSVSRRIVEADNFSRAGKFEGWAPMLMLGQDISEKTLGVVGTGRIGTAFALKSKGFNMKVLYVDNKRNEKLERELGAEKVDLDELLKQSDFISLHVPLLSSTRHLISEKQLRMMKSNAILINTSRGPVIDEKALIKALKEKWIFGAGLDVYENEPEIPEELKELDNVVLQPHSASATIASRTGMAIIAAKNMIVGLRGDIPPNCVNPEVFEKEK